MLTKQIAEDHPETIALYAENAGFVQGVIERVGDILAAIAIERARQEKKWGIQNLPDRSKGSYCSEDAREISNDYKELPNSSWQKVLSEEIFEAFAEEDPKKIAGELIQVAAVCVSWIEALAEKNSGK